MSCSAVVSSKRWACVYVLRMAFGVYFYACSCSSFLSLVYPLPKMCCSVYVFRSFFFLCIYVVSDDALLSYCLHVMLFFILMLLIKIFNGSGL